MADASPKIRVSTLTTVTLSLSAEAAAAIIREWAANNYSSFRDAEITVDFDCGEFDVLRSVQVVGTKKSDS